MADTPVSIREVAALAGVSLGTVSNVLNRPEVVAEPTRSRVQAAIKELGFIRNESARQLRAGRSRTIGLVVLDVANPFFTDVARGVEDEASEAGLAVILCNSDDQKAKESRYLEVLEEHRVQGILITPVSGGRQAAGQRAAPRHPGGAGGQPVTVARPVLGVRGRRARRRPGRVPSAGGRARADRVRGRPDERPAGQPTAGTGRVRALERAGRDGGDLLVIETPALNVAAGQRAGAALAGLPAATRPTAVFCANDLLALGVLQEMTGQPDPACRTASPSWATTTSSSPPRPRCRCRRSASPGISSAGPRPSC